MCQDIIHLISVRESPPWTTHSTLGILAKTFGIVEVDVSFQSFGSCSVVHLQGKIYHRTHFYIKLVCYCKCVS